MPHEWDWIGSFESLGFALTFVEGDSEGELFQAFGVDPAGAEVLTLAESRARFDYDLPVIRVGTVNEWSFAFEEIGRQAAEDDPLPELSTDTRAAQVIRTANALTLFRYAARGELICSIDVGMPQMSDGPGADHFIAALGPEANPTQAALALITTEFGLTLDAATITGPLLTGEKLVDISWLDE